MEKKLFICNTVYQILLALWIKETELNNEFVDIIISDHFKNAKCLANSLREENIFDEVMYVESRAYSTYSVKNSKIDFFVENCFPNTMLEKILGKALISYSEVYTANIDRFSLLVHHALKRRDREIQIHIYEDGLATYSSKFEKTLYYAENVLLLKWYKRILHRWIYKMSPIINDISDVRVFSKERIQWIPKDNLVINIIKKIDRNNTSFCEKCNRIFGFSTDDIYQEKYIFFEQPFEIDMGGVNDEELIIELTKIVGKNNLIVKTHPRNKTNRFQKMGIKTNDNTSIPWEVIMLNMNDLSSKVLITISSTCVIAPKLLFGVDTTVYSLYKLVRKTGNGEIFDTKDETFLLLQQYKDVIQFIEKIEDIK